MTANGDVLVADTENHRVRMISKAGIITTVAGTGERGYGGDDGPATLARLDRPFDVVALPAGGFLVADSNRVRRVAPDSTITTVAGSSEAGFSGDGGPANLARLSSPHGVTPLPGGGFLIADTGNQRIRRVSPDGTISTIAGTGTSGFSGDGGAAATASLDSPKAVEMAGDGGSYVIADAGNDRVRLVAGMTAPLVAEDPRQGELQGTQGRETAGAALGSRRSSPRGETRLEAGPRRPCGSERRIQCARVRPAVEGGKVLAAAARRHVRRASGLSP